MDCVRREGIGPVRPRAPHLERCVTAAVPAPTQRAGPQDSNPAQPTKPGGLPVSRAD
jgi:hypothetical protein